MSDKIRAREGVVMILKDAKTGRIERVVEVGPNIITDAGDLYYAQRSAVETPGRTFNKGQMVLAKSFTGATSVAAKKAKTFGNLVVFTGSYSGRQSFESAYPKSNDTDTDNTFRSADAATYKTIYSTSEGNGTVKAIAICRFGSASSRVTTAITPASLRLLLAFRTLSSAQILVKTSSQTLTVYVNHLFSGINP